MSFIEFKDVVKRYTLGGETIYALDHVSLHVGEGEYVAIIGPSGCGKSTALNLLCGLLKPTSGKIELFGEKLTPKSYEVLKRMGRRTSKADLEAIITKLRKEIPDIALRTTLITGFPGETEDNQRELCEFVKEMRFDRLGVFTYSPEEGTPAAKMEDQIEEEVKEARRDEIMELQQQIAFEKAAEMDGEVLKVMVEGKLPEDNIFVGRTYKDAPNVDGFIFVSAERELMSGDMIKAYVTEAQEYDLIGEMIEEYEE